MATTQEITNKAVGGRHLGPGGMTGAFHYHGARRVRSVRRGLR